MSLLMRPRLLALLALAATALALFQGCDGAPLTSCLPVGTDVSGRWQVSFADQTPAVVWQLSQCTNDVRGSELQAQQAVGVQGSIRGTTFTVARTPRTRTDGLDYTGQLVSDTRIQGTFTSRLGQTGFTAIRVQ